MEKRLSERLRSKSVVPKSPPKLNSNISKRRRKSTEVNKSTAKKTKAPAQIPVTRKNSNVNMPIAMLRHMNAVEMLSDAIEWTIDEVLSYLTHQGFSKQDVNKFKFHEIDGNALLKVKREDLKVLNLKLGTFVKLWETIEKVQLNARKD
jgi:hypothetical protein